ncbi:MAG TPA: redoxin family protein, partial [Planctomycetota bacterium]|nr:redoxin family protein [Planctomycetota bacterium]
MTFDVEIARAAAAAALAALVAARVVALGPAPAQSPAGARRLDEAAALPPLADAGGKTTTLAGEGAPPSAYVVAFTSSTCPVAAAQTPKVAALAAAYAPRGARVLLVDADVRDGAEAAAAVSRAAGAAGDSVPVLLDAEQRWAEAFRVERAAEVLVLDGARRVRYRGALDDELVTGMRKPAAQRRFAAEALDALLAGRPVALAETRAQGCLLTRRARPAAESPAIVYHRDVAPILRKHCVECHRPGEVGPFPLRSYDDAAGTSAMIREVVEQRRMPPWHADPRYGAWSNARGLDDAERATLIAWAASGAPEGAPPATPAEPAPAPPSWRIGAPDLVVRAPATRVPAAGTVDYRYVAVDAPIDGDRWVVAAEVHPGARAVVHHVVVFVQYPAARKHEQPESIGKIDGALLAGFVPGDRPMAFPAGTGKLVPKGS